MFFFTKTYTNLFEYSFIIKEWFPVISKYLKKTMNQNFSSVAIQNITVKIKIYKWLYNIIKNLMLSENTVKVKSWISVITNSYNIW